MKPFQRISILLLSILLALLPLQSAAAAGNAAVLTPRSIVTQQGSVRGSISALGVRDQKWWDDAPSRYVRFLPAARYLGYRTYQLPGGVTRGSVTALRIEANYFGPAKGAQTWTWSLYDWSAKVWRNIGDNAGAPEWEWRVLIFSPSNPRRFISPSGQIRLRLASNNGVSEARLDYEAIHILYAPAAPPAPVSAEIPLPPSGFLYHGVYPGGVTGEEDDITLADVTAYETAAGKRAAWVYFSHNWYYGRAFPAATAAWIRDHGSVPYIRLMLRSNPEQGRADPVYSLSRILSGAFDNDFHAWCAEARNFGTRLIAEYGVEVNGEWFPWNGRWNGGGTTTGYGDPNQPDGPERFRDAYRRIIQICRGEGAENITWVFHVNDGDWPEVNWNRFENYYPGDDYIDWLAVSSYGAQTPLDDWWPIFRESMDAVYPRLTALSPAKPIIVAEFGVTNHNPLGNQSQWARAALTDLTSLRWPRIAAFSWWNERWQNDDNPAHDTNMRIQDNPALAAVFQELVGNNVYALGQIPLITYIPSTADIPNPERGFYEGVSLDETDLTWYPAETGNRLLYLNARLDNYRDRDLPPEYLAALNGFFDLARQAGVKTILRFMYNNGETYPNPAPDASLPQALRHIEQIGPVLEANKDVIVWLEAGFIGAWGEWHTSASGLDSPENKAAIRDTLYRYFPQDRFILFRYPGDFTRWYPQPLTDTQAFTQSGQARTGHHNDCFLASDDDWGTYYDYDGSLKIEEWKAYLAQMARFTPISGETCNLNPPRSNCPTALAELERMHWSALQEAYHPDVIQSWKDQGCYAEIRSRLGYRLSLLEASFPFQARPGESITLQIRLQNSGFASPLLPRPAYLVLHSSAYTARLPLSADPRRWEPGEHDLIESVALPSDLPPGEYTLALWLPDPAANLQNDPRYAIRFANENVWDAANGWNALGYIIVQ